MNTLELESCLKQNRYTRKSFIGVYAADELPTVPIKKQKAIIIANTATSNHPGLHWICFVFSRNKIEFFDSSGQSYNQNKYFKQFVKINKNNKRIIVNKKVYQSKFSDLCGQYCLLYALFRSKFSSQHYFVKRFNKRNKVKNDKLVLKLYSKHFKHCIVSNTQLNNKCIQCCNMCK